MLQQTTLPLGETPQRVRLRDKSLWFVVASLIVTTLLHYLTDIRLIPYHSIYRSLYYLPIAVAAVRYGRRGGVLAALTATTLYMPHVIMSWEISPHDAFNDLLENVVFLFVGALVGTIADGEQRQRQRAQQAAQELVTANSQLQLQMLETRRMEEQVQRAQRLAALGRLAGGLAHEIRNPLGIVRAAAQLLQPQLTASPQHADYARVIQSEIDRVDGLIEQLLVYARPAPVARGLVDVQVVVERAVAITLVVAAQHQVALEAEVAPKLPLLEGDGELLHQALVNLLLNAIQATAPGGRVRVEAVGHADANDEGVMVELRVRDTGQGIALDDIGRVFDPFWSTRADGTGLGLSIVQQIVQAHGGTVAVQSQPGQGTTMTLQLPVTHVVHVNDQATSIVQEVAE
jgi:two-component system, NtrC family, sensor histidine kinase HydH